MSVDYVIVSSNDNPLYMDFWPIFKKMTKQTLNAKPVLIHVSDSNEYEEDDDAVVIKIKQVTKNTGFQAQISRLWAPIFFKDKICMTSDIDMLPLSKEYFNQFKTNQDDFHILSANVYNNVMNYYPMCYNIAYGSTFEKVLELPNNFDEFYKKVLSVYKEERWDCDEQFLSTKINMCNKKYINIIKHKRFGMPQSKICKDRIDRLYLDTIHHYKNNKNLYIDFHCPRPYRDHKDFIDTICDIYTNN